MIATSDAFKSYLAQDGRTFKMKLVCGSKVYGNSDKSHISSLKIEGTLGGDNVGFGNTGCAKLEVTLFESRNVKFTGNRFKVYIGADLNGTETWEQLGEFKAEKPTVQNGATTFVGYDRMNEAGKIYKSNLDFSKKITAADVWAELCQGITKSTGGFEALPTGLGTKEIKTDALSGFSFRAAMGYLAAYLGCNAVVNRFGNFEMRKIFQTEKSGIISPDNCETPETEEEDYQLGYIVCNIDDEKEPLKVGSGDRGFSCVCPLMTKARLETLTNAYLCSSSATSPVKFRVGTVNVIKGDFRIEVGDWLSYNVGEDEKYVFPVMKQTFEFDGGIMNTLESFGKTPDEESGSVLSLENRIKEAVSGRTKAQAEAVRDFSKAINRALGLYETEITNADGSKQTYLHDREDIADSTYIATVNAGGFAFATGEGCWNSGNPTYTSGMTAAGNAVMNTINTYKISAKQINVGDLSALKATIAGWSIGNKQISKSISSADITYTAIIQAATSEEDGAFVIRKTVTKDGTETITRPFRVYYSGKLEATDAVISGKITATSLTLTGDAKLPYSKLSNPPDLTVYIKKNGAIAQIGGVPGLNTTGFEVSSKGLLTASNAIIYGTIYAKSGEIAGITINSGSLRYGNFGENDSFSVTPKGTTNNHSIAGSDSVKNWILSVGSRFGVTSYGTVFATNAVISGTITATGGSIGGFTVDNSKLECGTSPSTGYFLVKPSGTTGKFDIAGSGSTADWSMIVGSKFGVKTDGTIWATGARISGKITATSGEIAGWDLSSSRLSKSIESGGTTYEAVIQAASAAGSAAFAVVKTGSGKTTYPFRVFYNGKLEATDADISGTITATGGSIGGFGINSSRMLFGTTGSASGFLICPGGTSGKYDIAGSGSTADWAMIVGSKFGVKTDGSLWATGLVAQSVLLVGTSTVEQMVVTGSFVFYKNTPIRYQTSFETVHTVLNYDGTVKVGIDVSNLRLYGKAVYLGSTSTAVTSDIRLKTDIHAFSKEHEAFFSALKPRSFKYTEGTSGRTHFGFIAQDVKNAIEKSGLSTQQAAVYVELESDREGFDGTECALRYSELIALNTHMIQKLNGEIACLKERIMVNENDIQQPA